MTSPPEEAAEPEAGRRPGVARRLGDRAAGIVWGAGTALVALVAASAALQLTSDLAAIWRDFPGAPGLAGLAITALLLGAAAVLTRHRFAAGARRGWLRLMPWSGVALVLATRGAAVALVDSPLSSDPRFLHELAVGALEGENSWLVAHRPMGYSAILAAAYAAVGADPRVAEIVNLACSLLSAAALYALTRAAWGRGVAATAMTLYAVAPSQVLLVPPVLTETLYTALLLGATLAVVMAGRRGGSVPLALAGGALLAVSQYVRPMSQALLVALAAAPLLGRPPMAGAWRVPAAVVLAFAVVLIPLLASNLRLHGDLSLSSSAYGGWSLYVGANQESDGRFNEEDARVLASQPGASWWERSERMEALAIERIAADPRGYAELLVRKFWVFWSSEDYGVTWSMRDLAFDRRVPGTLALLSQLFWVGITAGSLVAALRLRRARPLLGMLILSMALVIGVAHLFLEVQGRYHAYLVPFFIALAARAAVGAGSGADDGEPPAAAARARSGDAASAA